MLCAVAIITKIIKAVFRLWTLLKRIISLSRDSLTHRLVYDGKFSVQSDLIATVRRD